MKERVLYTRVIHYCLGDFWWFPNISIEPPPWTITILVGLCLALPFHIPSSLVQPFKILYYSTKPFSHITSPSIHNNCLWKNCAEHPRTKSLLCATKAACGTLKFSPFPTEKVNLPWSFTVLTTTSQCSDSTRGGGYPGTGRSRCLGGSECGCLCNWLSQWGTSSELLPLQTK